MKEYKRQRVNVKYTQVFYGPNFSPDLSSFLYLFPRLIYNLVKNMRL